MSLKSSDPCGSQTGPSVNFKSDAIRSIFAPFGMIALMRSCSSAAGRTAATSPPNMAHAAAHERSVVIGSRSPFSCRLDVPGGHREQPGGSAAREHGDGEAVCPRGIDPAGKAETPVREDLQDRMILEHVEAQPGLRGQLQARAVGISIHGGVEAGPDAIDPKPPLPAIVDDPCLLGAILRAPHDETPLVSFAGMDHRCE